MGRAADAACIQYRMLNRGKGPAVHSLRAQADRVKYRTYMKHTLERTENLSLKQAEVVSIETDEHGAVCGVTTAAGAQYAVRAAIVCSGTFLGGRIIIGEFTQESGPDGMFAARRLTDSLRGLGLRLQRFKTGTPPRVNRRSICFDGLEVQEGEREIIPFSFDSEHPPANQVVCHLTYTNADTHRVIRETWTARRCFRASLRASGRATARPSRTRSCASPTSPATSSFWSPWALRPRRSMCRGSRRPCPRRCRSRCCTPSRVWSTPRSCARPMPSSMTAWTRPSCCPRWNAARYPACTARASSTARRATRRRRRRAWSRASMPRARSAGRTRSSWTAPTATLARSSTIL